MLLLAVERRVCFTIENLAPAAPAFDHLLARLRDREGLLETPRPCAAAAPATTCHARCHASGAAAMPPGDCHARTLPTQPGAAHAPHAELQAAREAADTGAGATDGWRAPCPAACSGAAAGVGALAGSCSAVLCSCSATQTGDANGDGAAPVACLGGWRHLRGTRMEAGDVPRVLDYERGSDLELWQLRWERAPDVIAVQCGCGAWDWQNRLHK